MNGEIYYIEFYKSKEDGYNLSEGGSTRLGVKETQETIDKKKAAWTDEKRKEQSEKFKGDKNPAFGKIMEETLKLNMSNNMI